MPAKTIVFDDFASGGGGVVEYFLNAERTGVARVLGTVENAARRVDTRRAATNDIARDCRRRQGKKERKKR